MVALHAGADGPADPAAPTRYCARIVSRVPTSAPLTVAVTSPSDCAAPSRVSPTARVTEESWAMRPRSTASTVYCGTHCAGSAKRGSRRLAPVEAFSMTARVRPGRVVANTTSVG